MVTLLEEVVSLESEAESILANAHAEAKSIEKTCGEEVAAHHQKLTEELNRRIAEYQKEAEEGYLKALSEAQKELARSLDALDHISEDSIHSQTEKIIEKLISSI